MVDFFDSLYGSVVDKSPFLKKLRVYSIFRFLIRTISNLVLPIFYTLTKNNLDHVLPNHLNTSPRILVSLTSFPKRIDKVWLVVETLLRQSVKPNQIILWLSQEQFRSVECLPTKLLQQRERGLKIELMQGDLRSHKKYYYSRLNFYDDIIITVDDDIFYPTNTIQQLIAAHDRFPNSIIARYGYKISTKDNKIESYNLWDKQHKQLSPSYEVFFGSGGGTLFPPMSLPAQVLSSELFTKICPNADDVWLNTLCRVNDVPVFKIIDGLCSILPVLNRNDLHLSSSNLYGNENDVQLERVRKYFRDKTGVDPFHRVFEPNL